MARRDTAHQGAQQFPSTIWNDVLAAGDATSPHHRQRLEQLLKLYWAPVFAYVRASWRKPVEDAKDLTQAFFAHILEKGYLAKMRPGLGTFRGYLKRALKNFLIDAERHASARRPDSPLLSLDAAPAELERIGPAAPDEPPERAYDREWSRQVLDQAVADLKGLLASQGKQKYFDVFHAYFLEGAGPVSTKLTRTDEQGPTYDDVAARLGIKVTDVRNYLTSCRKLLRELIRGRIRDYVERDDEVDSELDEILRIG